MPTFIVQMLSSRSLGLPRQRSTLHTNLMFRLVEAARLNRHPASHALAYQLWLGLTECTYLPMHALARHAMQPQHVATIEAC